MREILFRGQTRKYGEKVKMNGEKLPSNWVYGGVFAPHQNEKGFSIIYTYDIETNKYPVYADTVGQYTGLKDKNGKKIFEGDIVKGSWNTVFEVYFDNDFMQFRAKTDGQHREIDYYGDSKKLEVIGNIYDNPELSIAKNYQMKAFNYSAKEMQLKKAQDKQFKKDKKYELTNKSIEVDGKKLYRIRALKNFSAVKKGDFGGYIENEKNLSQEGNCWVYENGKVYGNANVRDDAEIFNNAVVKDNANITKTAAVAHYARISDNAHITDNAIVSEKAKVFGAAIVRGDAIISNHAKVFEYADVANKAKVLGKAQVCGNARVYDLARICGEAKLCVNASIGGTEIIDGTSVITGYETQKDLKKIQDKQNDFSSSSKKNKGFDLSM